MSLKNWSGQKIGRLWLYGILVEVVLIAVGIAGQAYGERSHRPSNPPAMSNWRTPSPGAADSLRRRAKEELAMRGIQVDHLADSLITFAWSDSEVVTLRIDSGQTSQIDITPAARERLEAAIEPHANAIEAGLRGAILTVLLGVAAIYLPIPLVLVCVTVAWVVIREHPTITPS